jgi:catechol 2,3-dioxygenase-like lactoylglutathione lyase family enzyme
VRGEAAPRLDGVIETALYVRDMAAARAFYVDALGCEPMLETDRLVALSVAGRSVLLLFQAGATEQPLLTERGVVPGHGARGAQHMAFAIARDQVSPWLERLAAAGIDVESRVTWTRGGESIYFRDPDGHSIELVTPGIWPTY